MSYNNERHARIAVSAILARSDCQVSFVMSGSPIMIVTLYVSASLNSQKGEAHM